MYLPWRGSHLVIMLWDGRERGEGNEGRREGEEGRENILPNVQILGFLVTTTYNMLYYIETHPAGSKTELVISATESCSW